MTMINYLRVSSALIITLLSLTGCCHHCSTVADKELGPAMLRLTSAVQGVAERPDDYGFSPNGSGEDCIRLGTKDDPGLLTPFEGYVLRAKCDNLQAVVLLCNAGGHLALMEDAGCTAKLDSRADGVQRACDFSLDVAHVCQ